MFLFYYNFFLLTLHTLQCIFIFFLIIKGGSPALVILVYTSQVSLGDCMQFEFKLYSVYIFRLATGYRVVFMIKKKSNVSVVALIMWLLLLKECHVDLGIETSNIYYMTIIHICRSVYMCSSGCSML